MDTLTRITLRGFRSFRELDLGLGDLTVLIGANGAGKSNLVAFFNMMSFLLSGNSDQQDTERYFKALRRAQQEIDLEPEPYKHYYAHELPADLLELVDVRRFGPGERIVFEPYTREMYERTQRWMQTWNLFAPEDGVQTQFEAAVVV